MIDLSRAPFPPFKHQVEDAELLFRHSYFMVASEMRTGKTKIVVDAMQALYEAKILDTVIVVAPQPVRDVWYDRELGQIAMHAWKGLPMSVTEFHSKPRAWAVGGSPDTRLRWFITNYEWLRDETALEALLNWAGPKTAVVFDESSYLRNAKSAQYQACARLRWACGRAYELNGTPLYKNPRDLFAQANLLHPSILECRYISNFEAKYAIKEPVFRTGGEVLKDRWNNDVKTIVGWTKEGLEDLQRRMAPITVRRLQADCIDMPPKLEPVPIFAPLGTATWKHYASMRDELVVWLDKEVASATTAALKVMRLAQITSGFLGGIEAMPDPGLTAPMAGLLESLILDEVAPMTAEQFEELVGVARKGLISGTFFLTPEHDDDGLMAAMAKELDEEKEERKAIPAITREIGREKLDALIWLLSEKLLAEDPNGKAVILCRFRPEAERTTEVLARAFPTAIVKGIWGGQGVAARREALALLRPETAPRGPAFAVAVFGTAAFGLDFQAASTCISLSHDYSPGRHAQAADRIAGPKQQRPMAYYEVVATGPKGQKTIDHKIIATRRAGGDVNTWTAAAWVKALKEEKAAK